MVATAIATETATAIVIRTRSKDKRVHCGRVVIKTYSVAS